MPSDYWLNVGHLDVDRLLTEWRWLCPERVELVARNAYGHLFLRNASGQILYLDVEIGKLTKVAGSEAEFRESINHQHNQEQWFAKSNEVAAAQRGLTPNLDQCIAFDLPTVVKLDDNHLQKPWLADLYEYVSFLGDVNHQIADLPDGTPIRFVFKNRQD